MCKNASFFTIFKFEVLFLFICAAQQIIQRYAKVICQSTKVFHIWEIVSRFKFLIMPLTYANCGTYLRLGLSLFVSQIAQTIFEIVF